MHCLASSLCFWLWTIFRETAEYIQNYPGGDYDSDDDQNVNGNYCRTWNLYWSNLKTLDTSLRNGIVPYRFTGVCEHDELNVIYQNYSPYLYPFSVEYCILVGKYIALLRQFKTITDKYFNLNYIDQRIWFGKINRIEPGLGGFI